MAQRTRRQLIESDNDANVWPSFTDLISTVALILFVLVLLAYIKNLISGKRLEAYEQQISMSEQKLRALETDLKRTTSEIELGQRQLRLSERELETQKDVIAESNRELGNLRSRLSGIALLRVGVLEKVKTSIEREIGPKSTSGAPLVVIGDNGNIVINEGLVFEYNSYALKPDGKGLLETLSRAMQNVLADADVRSNVDAIVIQGHTDAKGSSAFNRDLSAKRANAVLDYMFEVNPTLEQDYGSYFASSAFSEFRPIDKGTDDAAAERNRRIEISVVLKDENVRRVIEDYTERVDPELQPPAPPAP